MGNIHPTAKIHPSTFIHPTALIGPNVTIGKDCYIGPYCLIGEPPEFKGWETSLNGVEIGDRTRITGLVTIDSGAHDKTIVGRNCYIMKGAHLGHDVIVFDDVTISCGAKVGGHSVVCSQSNIGLNATIHQKVTIPHNCMIGMGAAVTKKLEMKPYSKYAGVPARYIGENIRP